MASGEWRLAQWCRHKLSGGLYRELWEPSHLSVDPRNKWDFKFGPLIFISGPG